MNKARIGKRIRTLSDLMAAAKGRRSVIIKQGSGMHREPAAFAVNYTGAVLFQLLSRGMYLYKAVKPIDQSKPPRVRRPKQAPPMATLNLPYYPDSEVVS